MQLLRPPPEVAPFGLRAMKMVATADGPIRPGTQNLLGAAQRILLGTDVALDALTPVSPAELAAALVDPVLRRQFVQGMLMVSLADGPPSPAQMDIVDGF